MSPFLHPTFLLSILIALSVHEWAHAMTAYRLGDPTAKEMGRLTLNPVAHLDPIGTILFLVVGFGWGKPVPIDPRYFRSPKRDAALTALAGPLSNLILAFAAFLGLALLARSLPFHSVFDLLSMPRGGSVGSAFLLQFLASSLFINLGLMAFNLLPVAPLDGSKIIHPFIPYRYEDSYERFMHYGPYILLFLLLAGNFGGFPFLSVWIEGVMNVILNIFFAVIPLRG